MNELIEPLVTIIMIICLTIIAVQVLKNRK